MARLTPEQKLARFKAKMGKRGKDIDINNIKKIFDKDNKDEKIEITPEHPQWEYYKKQVIESFNWQNSDRKPKYDAKSKVKSLTEKYERGEIATIDEYFKDIEKIANVSRTKLNKGNTQKPSNSDYMQKRNEEIKTKANELGWYDLDAPWGRKKQIPHDLLEFYQDENKFPELKKPSSYENILDNK